MSDRLAEIPEGDINLSEIKRNLRQCEGPILHFEELEKTTLARHKQDQYDKQVLKLSTTIKGGLGMVHILIQCQVDEQTEEERREGDVNLNEINRNLWLMRRSNSEF